MRIGGWKRFCHLQIVVHVKASLGNVPAVFLCFFLDRPSSLADLKFSVDFGFRSAVFREQPGDLGASAEGEHRGRVDRVGPHFRIMHPGSPVNKIIERYDHNNQRRILKIKLFVVLMDGQHFVFIFIHPALLSFLTYNNTSSYSNA